MTTRLGTMALTCAVALTTACASSQSGGAPSAHHHRNANDTRSPEARYRAAVQLKFAGDAHGYYDELLQLAVDVPDSRAGRRARATLRSVDMLSGFMMMNALGSMVVPARHGLITGLTEGEDDSLLKHLLRDVEKPRSKDQQFADEGQH